MSHIIVIGALPESLVNFRGDFIRSLVEGGNHVTAMAATPSGGVLFQIEALGASFSSFPVQRNGLNPVKDLQTLLALFKVFQQAKPDVILAYTIKPVIWGGLAAFLSRKNFYALITGLGFAFEGRGAKRTILRRGVSLLYRLALLRAKNVIFQNQDNREEFVKLNIVDAVKSVVVSGSGVNMDSFKPVAIPKGPPHFLLIARLLGEKGVREYVQAAKLIKDFYPEATFSLLGPEDPSPDGLSLEEVQKWYDQGLVQYLGATDDVRPYLADCHIFVLPSYHEGMPRTVLEAMATGRPILTTDAPGCRETVIPGENGFLVPPRNAEVLAERMVWFIENRDQWERMGKRSRELAEEKFDVRKVNRDLMKIMGIEPVGD